MIVLDASAVVELLLHTPAGAMVAERIADPTESVHVPHLVDVEVAHVLRRYVAARELSAAEAGTALDVLRDLPLDRHPHDVLLDRIWDLRSNLSAYDATYVALAEALDAVLLTCDARLARAVGSTVRIRVVTEGPLGRTR